MSHRTADEVRRDALLAQWRAVFIELQAPMSGPVAVYSYPAEDSAPPAGDGDRDAGVLARLRRARTAVHFAETDLDDVAAFLGRISGTEIAVLPAVRDGRTPEELSIDLVIGAPESVDRLLDLITAFRGLTWTAAHGRVSIGLPKSPAGEHVIRLYDVKDIATVIENFPGYDCHFHSGE